MPLEEKQKNEQKKEGERKTENPTMFAYIIFRFDIKPNSVGNGPVI
jgi:hypothetical protein